MIDLETRTNIDKPAPAVYDFVVTHYVQNHPRWDPRVVSTELNGGGPLAVGSTGREVRKQMGREMTYDFRVTELTPDHVTFDANGSGTRFGAVWAVTSRDGGSELAITFHLGMGGVMRLFEPMMKSGVRKEMEQAAQRIKQLVSEPNA